MNTAEAKFILAAYRPGGGDEGDPAFAEALRLTSGDPHLGTWFAQARALDLAVAGKLAQIPPPYGLREAILAGARAGGRPRRPAATWGWVAAAAALVVAVGLYALRSPPPGATATRQLADYAISDMVHGKHGSRGAPAGALVARLQTEGAPMPGAGDFDFENLRETGCRTLNFAGHDLLEVCFVRDGAEFHLYVTRRDGPLGDAVAKGPDFVSEAGGAAAVWSDGRYDYAVATGAGVAALRRLL